MQASLSASATSSGWQKTGASMYGAVPRWSAWAWPSTTRLQAAELLARPPAPSCASPWCRRRTGRRRRRPRGSRCSSPGGNRRATARPRPPPAPAPSHHSHVPGPHLRFAACPGSGRPEWSILIVCLVASMGIAIVPPVDDADRNPRRRIPRPAGRQAAIVAQCGRRCRSDVSINRVQRPSKGRRACSLVSWLGPTVRRRRRGGRAGDRAGQALRGPAQHRQRLRAGARAPCAGRADRRPG